VTTKIINETRFKDRFLALKSKEELQPLPLDARFATKDVFIIGALFI
jgi:hypothetical protein